MLTLRFFLLTILLQIPQNTDPSKNPKIPQQRRFFRMLPSEIMSSLN